MISYSATFQMHGIPEHISSSRFRVDSDRGVLEMAPKANRSQVSSIDFKSSELENGTLKRAPLQRWRGSRYLFSVPAWVHNLQEHHWHDYDLSQHQMRTWNLSFCTNATFSIGSWSFSLQVETWSGCYHRFRNQDHDYWHDINRHCASDRDCQWVRFKFCMILGMMLRPCQWTPAWYLSRWAAES